MMKLEKFVASRTEGVLQLNNQFQLKGCYDNAAKHYKGAK